MLFRAKSTGAGAEFAWKSTSDANEWMRISNTGNLGISNSAPTHTLSVNGTTFVNTYVAVGNSTVNAVVNSTSIYWNSSAAAAITLSKPSANGSRIDIIAGANVASQGYWSGVHFTPPGSFTNSTSGTAYPRTSHYYEYTSTANPSDLYYYIRAGNDGGIGNGLRLYSSTTAGATGGIDIAANGNIGIGNTAPTDKLSVNGTTYHQGNVILGSASVAVGLQANGSYGSANQVLTSNGTSVYWANASSGGASANSTGGTGAVQYYNGTTLGSSTNLVFDGTKLSIGNSSVNTTVNSTASFVQYMGMNGPTISDNYTVPGSAGGIAVGPVTVTTGKLLTITTGSRLVII